MKIKIRFDENIGQFAGIVVVVIIGKLRKKKLDAGNSVWLRLNFG